jgi:hypothetical protein
LAGFHLPVRAKLGRPRLVVDADSVENYRAVSGITIWNRHTWTPGTSPGNVLRGHRVDSKQPRFRYVLGAKPSGRESI